ncbi:hypothetical protein ACIBCD_25845 [Nocardia brasiliensis]|uniref:hypothetical protein n=1 Tax=Nocardia brasiliensis TaxID=37326 RepID=UPI0037AB0FC7
MSDLKSFVALQTRVFEFLEQQDEATLRAILDRTAQLAVVPARDTNAQVGSDSPQKVQSTFRSASVEAMSPSTEPMQAANDLMQLRPGQERRSYLNAAGLSLKSIREVAKLIGLVGYSKIPKARLVDRLADHNPSRTEMAVGGLLGSGAAAPGANGDTVAGQHTSHHSQKSSDTPSEVVERSGTGFADIAACLRETETEEDGAAYLRTQNLNRDELLGVAAELQLTRVSRLSQGELEKRILKQAIGARRKFSGLRKW